MNSIFMNDGTLVCYEFKSALIKDFQDNQNQEPGSHQSDQSSKIIVTVDRDTNMHLKWKCNWYCVNTMHVGMKLDSSGRELNS